jgi:hypothetical protein
MLLCSIYLMSLAKAGFLTQTWVQFSKGVIYLFVKATLENVTDLKPKPDAESVQQNQFLFSLLLLTCSAVSHLQLFY